MIRELNTIVAADLDVTALKGDTLAFFVDFFENDEVTPYLLNNYTDVNLFVKRSAKEKFAILKLSLGSGLTVSSNRLSVLATDTQMNIKQANYFYDVEGVRASGVRETFLRGRFIVKQDITEL